MHLLDLAALPVGIGGQWRHTARECVKQDVAGDGCGHRRAAAAMFDNDRDGIFRRVKGGVADEQCMVAAVPGQLIVTGDATGALCGGDIAHLAGAGLAGHAPFLGHDPRFPRRPGGRVYHRIHAAPGDAQVAFAQTEIGEFRGLDRNPVDGAHEARLDLAPGRHPRRHHRQLQGRGQHETLPDRGIERIADHPGLVEAFLLPRPVGGDAGGDGRHRQVMFDPDTQSSRHRRDAVDAGGAGGLVIEDIAGFLQALHRVHMAVAAPAPAMELAAGDFQRAIAEEGAAVVDNARLKPGQQRDHLEGRAGRIDALHGLVGQRAVVMFGQRLVIGRGNATHEQVRIEDRVRGNGHDIAIGHVDDHGGGGFLAQALHGVILQPRIQRHLQGGALLALLPAEFAHLAACGVHLDLANARLAAQDRFQLVLGPDLAELEFRQHQHRVGIFHFRQVVIRDPTDIAQHMGEIAPARIDPRQNRFRLHAGQRRCVHGDRAELVPTQVIADADRGAGAALGDSRQQLGGLLVRHRHQQAQLGHYLIDIAGQFAGDGGTVILFIAGDHQTIAVMDQPAHRRQQAKLDRVAIRKQPIFVGMFDLHRAQPPGQRADHRRLNDAQHHPAPRDDAGAVDHVLGRFTHQFTVISSSAVLNRLMPITCTASTTSG